MKIPKICMFQYVILFSKNQKIVFLFPATLITTYVDIKVHSLKYFLLLPNLKE